MTHIRLYSILNRHLYGDYIKVQWKIDKGEEILIELETSRLRFWKPIKWWKALQCSCIKVFREEFEDIKNTTYVKVDQIKLEWNTSSSTVHNSHEDFEEKMNRLLNLQRKMQSILLYINKGK
jgi:hypothetical protein